MRATRTGQDPGIDRLYDLGVMIDVVVIATETPESDYVEVALLNEGLEIVEGELLFRTIQQRNLMTLALEK